MKKKTISMPFHNTPKQIAYWFVWVIVIAAACFLVSLRLFYLPKNTSPLPQKENVKKDHVQTLIENKEKLEHLATTQNDLSNSLESLKHMVSHFNDKTDQSEAKMVSLTTAVLSLKEEMKTASKTTVMYKADSLQPQKNQGQKSFFNKKIEDKSALEIRAFAQHVSSPILKENLILLAEIKEKKGEKTIFHAIDAFYNVLHEGEPYKSNILATYSEEKTWKEYLKQVLSKVVYVTKKEENNGAMTWQKAMKIAKTAIKENNIEALVDVLSKNPLHNDARLNDVRTLFTYILAEKALLKKCADDEGDLL